MERSHAAVEELAGLDVELDAEQEMRAIGAEGEEGMEEEGEELEELSTSAAHGQDKLAVRIALMYASSAQLPALAQA